MPEAAIFAWDSAELDWLAASASSRSAFVSQMPTRLGELPAALRGRLLLLCAARIQRNKKKLISFICWKESYEKLFMYSSDPEPTDSPSNMFNDAKCCQILNIQTDEFVDLVKCSNV